MLARVGILMSFDGRHFVHEGAGVGAFAREVKLRVICRFPGVGFGGAK